MIVTLSSQPVSGRFEVPVNANNRLLDHELGGPALNANAPTNEFVWRGEVLEGNVMVGREGVPAVSVLNVGADVSDMSFAFNSGMQTHVAYVKGGVAYFYWWNSLVGAYETMTLTGARSPRCCSDEMIPEFAGDRDLIVAYIVGTELRARYQRERFQIEHVHATDLAARRLLSFGMGTQRRVMFRTAN